MIMLKNYGNVQENSAEFLIIKVDINDEYNNPCRFL